MEYTNQVHSVEEKLNAMTHSIGTGLSIAGFGILIYMMKSVNASLMMILCLSSYAIFQILLYLSSALTHAFSDKPQIYKVFRIIDQASIYLLIAGTYTPAALLGLKGRWGWILFFSIWTLALFGILSKTLIFREKHLLSDLLYLPMGWLIIIAIKPMLDVLDPDFMKWIFFGGGFYSFGIIFYLSKRIPFAHVIWHLFVIAGGFSFFMGFVNHLF